MNIARDQIILSLSTMTRDELRTLALRLNVPRGKDKTNTVSNLTNAISNGKAQFKVVFTIKSTPEPNHKSGDSIYMKKLRSYGKEKVIMPVTAPLPSPAFAV